ncbi:hypothetical protein OG400_30225 [Micromonospora ureilytica]|uniref:hypothetical protein n=1 Tax=Micromonospora ureilytica TaxID=709868 RepID=UPI002E0DE8E5|nr:hypothetical protein OG400_30225 [Micromonospora ureilytica]
MCHAVIEEKGSPMSANDLFRLAVVDATVLQDRIVTAAGVTVDAVDDRASARALANALIAAVQDHLEQTSNEYDVDLFLEANGRQPAEVASWPVTILAGLRMRRTSADDWRSICDRAVELAVRNIRAASRP